MELKVRSLKWEAGRPVAILHKKTADRDSIHTSDRISVKKGKKEVIAIVDTAAKMLNKDEIILSKEVLQKLKIKSGNVEVTLAEKPDSIKLIHRKMNREILSENELKQIMRDIANNALTEAEVAYLISSIYNSNMTMKETADLTKAIVETGEILSFPGKVADKHSIGGIPGRTTPIVVSICASAGLIIPKTSSRAITAPTGTADAMEVLCKVDFSMSEVRKLVKKVGACLVWGGSLNLAPADDKIIQVERILNLDPESQMLASIMSKKISVGAKYVIIDLPYGKTAKVGKKQALRLKRKFEKLGKHFKMKVKAILFKTKEPLGDGIGPALEIIDAIRVLTRKSSCNLLEKKSLILAAELLELTGKAKKGKGLELATKILDSGQAYQKFKQIVKAQKGSLRIKNKFKFKKEIKANRTGKINFIDIKKINFIAKKAGCPTNKFSGIYLHKHLGNEVRKGEGFMTIYSETKLELTSAVKTCYKIKPIIIK